MSAHIYVASMLPAPAGTVWEAVKTSALLHEVARPLVRFRPAPGSALPAQWPVGVPVELRLYLFGAVPLGPHRLIIESVDDVERVIQTRERSPLIQQWDHRIHVEPLDPARARYSDALDLDAGFLTPLVVAFARVFFRHRHRRWRAVARSLDHAAPDSNVPDGVDRRAGSH